VDCRRIRKEKRKNERLGSEGKWVKKKMNSVGGGADCGRFRKEKSKNRRLWGEGKTVRRRMNGVGEGSRLRTDPQRKKKRGGGYGVLRGSEAVKIKRDLEDGRKQNKGSMKVHG